MTGERLFVYGMLLREPAGARERVAILRDYQLVFRDFATVEPALGEVVHGALVEIPSGRLDYFDQIEGCYPDDPKRGLYRRERVEVETDDGTFTAWVYVMNRAGWSPPSSGYLAMIHSGYVRLGLPVDALEDATRGEAWTRT